MAFDGVTEPDKDPLGELGLMDRVTLQLACGWAWEHACWRHHSLDLERMYKRLSGGQAVSVIHRRAEQAAGILMRDEWRNITEGKG